MRISEANLVIVDVETTGLDYAAGDRVVQVAAVRAHSLEHFTALVNPGRHIPAVASAVHQLEDHDVADASPIAEVIPRLRRWLGDDAILFAHNARFDSSFLPELSMYRFACTKRLAQKLVPEAENYANQTLRFTPTVLSARTRLELRGLAAHEALSDCLVTAQILRALISRYLAAGHTDDLDAFLAFEAAPIAYTHMPFGKNGVRNRPIAEVDSGYLNWCLRNMTDLDADLRSTFVAELDRRRGVRVPA